MREYLQQTGAATRRACGVVGCGEVLAPTARRPHTLRGSVLEAVRANAMRRQTNDGNWLFDASRLFVIERQSVSVFD